MLQRLLGAGPTRRAAAVAVPRRVLVQRLQRRLGPGRAGGLGDPAPEPGPAAAASATARYTVTARVAPPYAEIFGLSEEQATLTFRLDVLGEDDGGGEGEPPHSHRTPAYQPASPGAERSAGPRRRRPDAGPALAAGVGHQRRRERQLPAVLRHGLERRQQPARRRRLPPRGRGRDDGVPVLLRRRREPDELRRGRPHALGREAVPPALALRGLRPLLAAQRGHGGGGPLPQGGVLPRQHRRGRSHRRPTPSGGRRTPTSRPRAATTRRCRSARCWRQAGATRTRSTAPASPSA